MVFWDTACAQRRQGEGEVKCQKCGTELTDTPVCGYCRHGQVLCEDCAFPARKRAREMKNRFDHTRRRAGHPGPVIDVVDISEY